MSIETKDDRPSNPECPWLPRTIDQILFKDNNRDFKKAMFQKIEKLITSRCFSLELLRISLLLELMHGFKKKSKMTEESRLRFNIRGSIFEMLKDSLQTFPSSKISTLTTSSQYYDPARNEYFFDRDPEAFNFILNAFVTGELHVPKHMCGAVIRQEMDFWNIPKDSVSDCCWQVYFRFEEQVEYLTEIKRDEAKHQVLHTPRDKTSKDGIRCVVWNTLSNPGYSNVAMIWYYFYLFVVGLSTVIFCLSTVPELRTVSYLSDLSEHNVTKITNLKLRHLLFEDPLPVLLAVEMFCLLVFTFELILSISSCPRRLVFIKKWINIVNIILVISMWTTLALELDKEEIIENHSASHVYLITKAFNMLRLLLFVRLERQFKAFRVLLLAVRASAKELLLMCLSFMIAVLIFSSLMFYSEIYFTDSSYYNIFITMWWAIVTMTTVGYGDLYPTTTVGYIIGSLCTMCGLLILALPVAVIASNFSSYYACNNYRERYINFTRRNNISKSD
ncbi:hypothetical protein KUTeg_004620, partial [Tegillarca granosa]